MKITIPLRFPKIDFLEAMIILSIIAILFSIAFPAFKNYEKRNAGIPVEATLPADCKILTADGGNTRKKVLYCSNSGKAVIID